MDTAGSTSWRSNLRTPAEETSPPRRRPSCRRGAFLAPSSLAARLGDRDVREADSLAALGVAKLRMSETLKRLSDVSTRVLFAVGIGLDARGLPSGPVWRATERRQERSLARVVRDLDARGLSLTEAEAQQLGRWAERVTEADLAHLPSGTRDGGRAAIRLRFGELALPGFVEQMKAERRRPTSGVRSHPPAPRRRQVHRGRRASRTRRVACSVGSRGDPSSDDDSPGRNGASRPQAEVVRLAPRSPA